MVRLAGEVLSKGLAMMKFLEFVLELILGLAIYVVIFGICYGVYLLLPPGVQITVGELLHGLMDCGPDPMCI
jgi:hypothetical protein